VSAAVDISENTKNIHKLTSLVIQQLGPGSGINFGLNAESVKWVEGYIERIRRPGLDEKTLQGLVNTLGAFLGECLVANTPGVWAWSEQQETIGILFPGGGYAFPFNKVRKQLVDGREAGDSIAGFFDVVLGFQAAGKL
jgi:hypothetical protein